MFKMLHMLLLLQLQQGHFVTSTTIGDVKVQRDTPNPNPFPVVTGQGSNAISPNTYDIRYGNGMGYILVEHFVTLWCG